MKNGVYDFNRTDTIIIACRKACQVCEYNRYDLESRRIGRDSAGKPTRCLIRNFASGNGDDDHKTHTVSREALMAIIALSNVITVCSTVLSAHLVATQMVSRKWEVQHAS